MRRLYWLLIACASMQAQPIHHIILDGQSLSQGLHGSYNTSGTLVGPLSSTQPYANLMLGDGCNWNGSTCSYNGAIAFSPLAETANPSNYSGDNYAPNPGVETPASGIANTITALAGSFVSLVTHVGLNGTAYSGLKRVPASPGSPITGTTSYQNAMAAIDKAKALAAAAGRAYTVDALAIVHGEQDQYLHRTAAQYAADLVQWQADFSYDRNAKNSQSGSMPMFLTQIATWPGLGTTTPTDGSGNQGAALGQWTVARDNPGSVYLVGPEYPLAYYADGLHLTNIGYRTMGGQIGKAMTRVLLDNARWVPLAPRSIGIAGSTITLRLWVPAGSVAIDTSLVRDRTGCVGIAAGASYTTGPTCLAAGGTWRVSGLEYYDDTASAYISGVSVASADTLAVQLSAAPSGANQRLRAAYTAIPNSNPLQAGGVGANIRDSDATVDASGVRLYNWLVTFDEPLGYAWNPYVSAAVAGSAVVSGGASLQ